MWSAMQSPSDIESVLLEAAPLATGLEGADSTAQDDSIRRLLAIAVAHMGSADSPFTRPPLPPEEEVDDATLSAARDLAEAMTHLRPRDGTVHVVGADADACLRSIEMLQSRPGGRRALRLTRAIPSLVETLPLLEADAFARWCAALTGLVRADPACRDDANEAGAAKQACVALEVWSTNEAVHANAEALLHSLAFERADAPSACALPPRVHREGTTEAADDEELLDLAAAFQRQRVADESLYTGAHELPTGDESNGWQEPPADESSPMGEAAAMGPEPFAPPDEELPRGDDAMEGEGGPLHTPSDRWDALMTTDDDEGTAAATAAAAAAAVAVHCVFGGTRCSGMRTAALPACGHRVVCEHCLLAIQVMTEQLTPSEAFAEPQGGVDEGCSSTMGGLIRSLSRAWNPVLCPECAREQVADALDVEREPIP